jgi:hypothetical protein
MHRNLSGRMTRMFISTPWLQECKRAEEVFQRFISDGWCEEGELETGQRCLRFYGADLDAVRQAAHKNPGLIFQCFVMSYDSDDAVLHVGIGGTWAIRKIPACDAINPKSKPARSRPMPPRRSLLPQIPPARGFRSRKRSARGKSKSRARRPSGERTVGLTTPKPKAETATAVPVLNRLVFHGLPGEVERCRALAIDVLPEAERAATKFNVSGSESYASGMLEFTTGTGLALKAFNRLVAQVPAISVSLEYGDVKSGNRRLLQAVDGRIVEHKAT